ncbi:MAG: GNAT family N-acetyltransferase [Terracidiphilus sp.]
MGTITGLDGQITPPDRLTPDHDLTQFNCGEPSLDHWLRKRALQNEESGASRTYVVCAGARVAGYYALAAGSVAHSEATSRIKRNMPDPVPVILLGRLAIDSRFQGCGIGADLLRDAALRTLQVAEIAGVRALLVSAISENARRFYEKYGFISSPADPQTLMITLTEAARALAQLK